MSPLTMNSHWSRIKSSTLRRRNTDTDLSRLVDLPPMPVRLSQQNSLKACPAGTPKRKGVLVRVGDISPAQASEVVVVMETPVKKKRTTSQNQSQSQCLTDHSDTTTLNGSNLLVILETPPRPSIGAAASRIDPLSRVSAFRLLNECK